MLILCNNNNNNNEELFLLCSCAAYPAILAIILTRLKLTAGFQQHLVRFHYFSSLSKRLGQMLYLHDTQNRLNHLPLESFFFTCLETLLLSAILKIFAQWAVLHRLCMGGVTAPVGRSHHAHKRGGVVTPANRFFIFGAKRLCGWRKPRPQTHVFSFLTFCLFFLRFIPKESPPHL